MNLVYCLFSFVWIIPFPAFARPSATATQEKRAWQVEARSLGDLLGAKAQSFQLLTWTVIYYIYIYIYISNINVISILSQSWFERVESSSSFVIFVSLGFQANPASSKVKSHRGMRPHQGIDTFNILQRSGGGKNGFTKRKIYKSSKCVQHVRIWGSCWFQICSVWSFHKLSMALRKETVTRDK